jgi:TP901-1 family phage major tail protein
MGMQRGRDLVLQVGDGGWPESFATLSGLAERTFRFAASGRDVTDAASPGRWRELDGGGVRSLTVTGRGSLYNLVADQRLRDAFLSQATVSWRVTAPGLFVCSGPFLTTGLDYLGVEEGEAEWAVTLASAGALAFVAGNTMAGGASAPRG